jgi:glutathione peroxidase
VPSNDFGGQEPGGAAEIEHAAHGLGVSFPLAAKAKIRGADPHPFYKWAAAERPLETPRWNFHKYLVGRDGHLAGSFASAVAPEDQRLVGAIERQLGT